MDSHGQNDFLARTDVATFLCKGMLEYSVVIYLDGIQTLLRPRRQVGRCLSFFFSDRGADNDTILDPDVSNNNRENSLYKILT